MKRGITVIPVNATISTRETTHTHHNLDTDDSLCTGRSLSATAAGHPVSGQPFTGRSAVGDLARCYPIGSALRIGP
jgi:hypothetical protein